MLGAPVVWLMRRRHQRLEGGAAQPDRQQRQQKQKQQQRQKGRHRRKLQQQREQRQLVVERAEKRGLVVRGSRRGMRTRVRDAGAQDAVRKTWGYKTGRDQGVVHKIQKAVGVITQLKRVCHLWVRAKHPCRPHSPLGLLGSQLARLTVREVQERGGRQQVVV